LIGVNIVHELTEEKWRRFVEEHPQGNIFHTPDMFEVYSRVPGYRPELWAAIKGDVILALLLPLQINLMGGILRPLTTRSVVHGSILCAPGIEGQDAMFSLLQAYTQSVKPRPLFTELRNISDYSELQATLNKCGFVFEGHLNYLINLDQSDDAIWQGISKSVRKHIRNSQRKGVEIIDISDRQQLIAGYELVKMVYKRIRVPLASFKLFESAFEILMPRGMLKVCLARVNNHYISVRLVLTYKGVVYDWYMGTDRKFSSYYAEELLIWHTLHWGKENNYCLFDFGGAGKPKEEYGPRQFKAKWGGTLVNYGRNTYVHSPFALKLSKSGYELLRRVSQAF